MKKFKINQLHDRLFAMQDLKYRDFSASLMPTVDKERVIGIRTPVLRSFAKEFGKTEDSKLFLEKLPHRYYEENNLHAFLLEQIKDYDEVIRKLDEFLPYVDNWATCDCMNPKVFRRYPEKLIKDALRWIESDKTYVKRYGIGMIMRYFLDDNFKREYLEVISGIRSEEYYINMMTAWFFATALCKKYEEALPYIENHRLDVWTHNKSIQKAVESLRISEDKKAYLKTLRIKSGR